MAQGEQHAMRVLISVDRSELAEKAFDHYAEHLHRPGNEVIVLHVSDQVKMPTYALFTDGVGFNPDEMVAMVERLKEDNAALEEKYNKKCKDLKMKHKFLLVSDDVDGPGNAVCEYAKKHGANLIVVGSRGQGTLRRTFLGSVSTYVIHHSHIPTIVCPV